jgi:hypothetical protein
LRRSRLVLAGSEFCRARSARDTSAAAGPGARQHLRQDVPHVAGRQGRHLAPRPSAVDDGESPARAITDAHLPSFMFFAGVHAHGAVEAGAVCAQGQTARDELRGDTRVEEGHRCSPRAGRCRPLDQETRPPVLHDPSHEVTHQKRKYFVTCVLDSVWFRR